MRTVERLGSHVDLQCEAETNAGARCTHDAAYLVTGSRAGDGYVCGVHERVIAREERAFRGWE